MLWRNCESIIPVYMKASKPFTFMRQAADRAFLFRCISILVLAVLSVQRASLHRCISRLFCGGLWRLHLLFHLAVKRRR